MSDADTRAYWLVKTEAVRRWNTMQWRWAGRIPAPRVTVVAAPRRAGKSRSTHRLMTAPLGTPPPKSLNDPAWRDLGGLR